MPGKGKGSKTPKEKKEKKKKGSIDKSGEEGEGDEDKGKSKKKKGSKGKKGGGKGKSSKFSGDMFSEAAIENSYYLCHNIQVSFVSGRFRRLNEEISVTFDCFTGCPQKQRFPMA